MSTILNDYCDQCPFPSNGKNLGLHKDRIPEAKENLLKDDFRTFPCHKTLDDKRPKMCYGAARFLEEKKRPNIAMRIEKWKSKESF
jgi:hypothetical protein